MFRLCETGPTARGGTRWRKQRRGRVSAAIPIAHGLWKALASAVVLFRGSARCAERSWRRVAALAVCLVSASLALTHVGPAAQPVRSRLERLQSEYVGLHAQFAADMVALAEFCASAGFADEAARIRQLAVPIDEQTADIDRLPDKQQPPVPKGLDPVEQEWRLRLRTLQTAYAQNLFLLSRRAINDGLPSQAFHWTREAAFHNPDHQQARRALGYVPFEDGWSTPFAADRQRKGFVWHERFGWLPRTHVERYERGERYYNGRWIPASKEASIRSDFRQGWRVLTEHFEIHTNHSLERGVDLGRALEDYHRFFVREFAAFFNTPQQMQALFSSGSNEQRASRRHTIHYYRTRDEYVAALRPRQSNIEVTNGLYLPSDRVAYFFDDPNDPDGHLQTMFHEVTHQLLGESARTIANVGQDANFWIVEGIACYMESFRRDGDRLTVGDPRHPRIHWARVRVAEESFFVPLQQFCALGMREFQFGVDLPMLQRYYSQAAGLVHFFLHYDGGVYRDALITHLSQVYSPDSRVRSKVAGLDELTGISYDELGRQYAAYISSLPGAHRDARTAQP